MLEHEVPETQAVPSVPGPPASERRVSPEELAAALSALEARQQQAARYREGTVPIGQVVTEMGLDATPEEIWAQVEQQRAQAAQKQAQKQAQTVRPAAVPAVSLASIVPTRAAKRRLLRGWSDLKGWLWILFWCCGVVGLITGVLHSSLTPAGITVSGDNVTSRYTVQGTGAQRDVTISGDYDAITLTGNVRNLTVDGDSSTVTVLGTVERVAGDGDNNTVHWTKELPGHSPESALSGDGNKVGLNGP